MTSREQEEAAERRVQADPSLPNPFNPFDYTMDAPELEIGRLVLVIERLRGELHKAKRELRLKDQQILQLKIKTGELKASQVPEIVDSSSSDYNCSGSD